MLGRDISGVFNTKVINNLGNHDWQGCMFPDKRGASNRKVSILGKVGGEEIAGDATIFFDSRHSFSDLNVKASFLNIVA